MRQVSILFSVLIFGSGFSLADDRPNILLILADDLSWADLGCYGHPLHETPNFDRLASRGVRFTQAYSSAPICSASRAALLTGKTTARLGFEFVVKPEAGSQTIPNVPLKTPPFTLDLPLEEITIAEQLGSAGYETAFFGKWHLNQHYKRYLGWSPTHGPKKQGFQIAEEDFGSHPYSYWGKKEDREFDDSIEPNTFPDDSMVGRANAFLRQKHEKPFFLMLSHFFVHDPDHTRLRWLYEKYHAKLPEGRRRKEKAHYAAMVSTLDHLVGETLTALDETGLQESTLIVFTSDNGGHPNYAGNAPLRGSKWNLYEGGIRVPMIASWPGKTPVGETCDSPVIGYDLLPTFAELGESKIEQAIDGSSFVKLLSAPKEKQADRPIFWHFPYYHPEKKFAKAPGEIGIDDGVTSKTRPHSAVRLGSKTLIHFFENNQFEMYDVATDLGQSGDLIDRDHSEVERRKKILKHFLRESKARIPQPAN